MKLRYVTSLDSPSAAERIVTVIDYPMPYVDFLRTALARPVITGWFRAGEFRLITRTWHRNGLERPAYGQVVPDGETTIVEVEFGPNLWSMGTLFGVLLPMLLMLLAFLVAGDQRTARPVVAAGVSPYAVVAIVTLVSLVGMVMIRLAGNSERTIERKLDEVFSDVLVDKSVRRGLLG
jgi:hypothetical protein